MKTRRCCSATSTLLFLLLQKVMALASERFVLSQTGNTSVLRSGQTLVALEYSSAALSDLLTTSHDLSPVLLNALVNESELILNRWRNPLLEMMKQSVGNDPSVLVDLQLTDTLDVEISKLLVQSDVISPEDIDVSLLFGRNSLAGLTKLTQLHVNGMKIMFQDDWLSSSVDVDQLLFDKAIVCNFALATTTMIHKVIIRNSALSFPTDVLRLETPITSLILENNTISSAIELTPDEYTKLLSIPEFIATGNAMNVTVKPASSTCVTIGGLVICIANKMPGSDGSFESGKAGSASAMRISGPLETKSTSISSSRSHISIIAIMLASVCTVALVVVLSFFRRFKRKTSKSTDGRLTFTNREDGLLTGRRSKSESNEPLKGEAKLLAETDLGKNQVTLLKKLGIQGLWLGELQSTKIVALKFVPQELNMSTKDLNALRHDNIVHFLGSSWTDCEEILIVVEYMPKGTLRSVLADDLRTQA